MNVTKKEIAQIVANTIAAVSMFQNKLKEEGIENTQLALPEGLIIAEKPDGSLRELTTILATEEGHTLGPLRLDGLDDLEEDKN